MAAREFGRPPRVAGVILAAGRSTRFEGSQPKQLYRVEGEPMVRRVVRTALASELRRVLLITGHRASEVRHAVKELAAVVVENPDFASGQASSVRSGLARLEPEDDAALFIPCDLPSLDVPTLDRLLGAYRATGGPIVVPTVAGLRRAPVLIDRSLFGEVGEISGDEGARQIFPRHGGDIVEVAFDSPRPFEDLDRLPSPD